MLFRDHVKDEGHSHGTRGSQGTALAEFPSRGRGSGVSHLRRIREFAVLAANAAASGQPWAWLSVADPLGQPHIFSGIANQVTVRARAMEELGAPSGTPCFPGH